MDFTCPNRDGSKGRGGCIYCNDRALYPSHNPGTLKEQISMGIELMKKRYGAEKFIVYFQSNTNTYGSLEKLTDLYTQAISFPSVVGLAIGTRPDCVSDELLEMLADLSRRTYLWMEYGLQSASDDTLKRINRCHTVADFTDAVLRTHKKNIEVVAHVIIGLPGEGPEHIIRTANYLSEIQIDGIKIHAFHIVKDTVAELWYNNNMIELLEMDDYVTLVVDMIERLSERVVIHRLTGEAPDRFLVAPQWVREKNKVLNRINELMKNRNTYQGRLCEKRSIIG
jgi:radical SAM protein (TIGR01212 family)